jgi:hypothetical protein
MHLVQRAGLPEDCRNPACLKTRPPSPAKGAAHNLQRGGDGICLNARRCLASHGLSPVSTARTCSVNSSAAIYPHRLILETAGKSRSPWKPQAGCCFLVLIARRTALSFRASSVPALDESPPTFEADSDAQASR